MSIYNHSDDISHDLEIYEQEQEKMDKREERLEQLTKEAEKIYRNEELGSLLCWCAETGRDAFLRGISKALEMGAYEQAGVLLNTMINTYAPTLAREYAEKRLAYEEEG